MSDEIRGLGVFAQVMPNIFLAVAAMVLNVLMTRLIDQQRSIVGTFKALGYSNAQVFWHFMKFGGLVGLCGGLVGLPMGYGMAKFITSIYRTFFEFPHLESVVYPNLYFISLLISLACCLLGCCAEPVLHCSLARPKRCVLGLPWRVAGFGWNTSPACGGV